MRYSLVREPIKYSARANTWAIPIKKAKDVTRVTCYFAKLWSMKGFIFLNFYINFRVRPNTRTKDVESMTCLSLHTDWMIMQIRQSKSMNIYLFA